MARFCSLAGAALLLGATLASAGNILPLRVEGIITAVMTPYHANATLNLKAVAAQAAYQKKTGVKGVFVGGTTGDSYSLTLQERLDLNKAWAVAAKANDLLFIVHVGAEALGDAVALAHLAVELKADAIGCMSSVFFKPANPEAMALWLQQVGQAAPSLPLYYYHIPSMTGVTFMMLDLIKAVEKVGVPSFVGVKYTGLYENKAFPDFEKCTRYAGGKYEILCGREEMTLEALSIGAKGFIGSQFNFAGDLYNGIAQVWQKNITRARQIQELGLSLIDAWGAVPTGVNGNRMVVNWMAGTTSQSIGPARLPSLQPDTATVAAFGKRLQAWCDGATQFFGGKKLAMCDKSIAQLYEKPTAVMV